MIARRQPKTGISRKETKVFLEPEHKKYVKYLAQMKGISVSNLISDLIQKEIKRKGGKI